MASQTVVQGIDVSQWQGAAFPWKQWAGKIGFAMAKAVEGDAETDPDFGANWNGMWEMNRQMPRFAYSYFHPSLDAVAQAAHLVATVKGHGLLPGDNFVLDLEVSDGLASADVACQAIECLRKVNELAPGHRVLVYTFPSFAQAGNCEGMESWFLWLADYGVSHPAAPAPWGRVTFWQSTDEPVDGDQFMGTEAELLEFCRMPADRSALKSPEASLSAAARVPGKSGRRTPKRAPVLQLGPLLTGTVPAHPLAADYLARLRGGWQMLGNDTAGDCVAVTWANIRRLVTTILTVRGYYPTQAQVWEVYKTQNPDFDPAGTAETNGPGSPADGGMDIQTLLERLVAAGGPDGVKAVAFMSVNPQNTAEVKAAIAIFGYVWTGINVLQVNMQEFSEDQPFGYSPASPVDGGHSVITGGYGDADRGALGGDERFITWAQETSFTDSFWQNEAEEAYVVVWPEHLGSKAFLEGVNVAKLAADYKAITGRELAIPVSPPPAPEPNGDESLHRALGVINAQLTEQGAQLKEIKEAIKMSQSDIDAATGALTGAATALTAAAGTLTTVATDLGTVQADVLAEIAALQAANPALDTTALASAVAAFSAPLATLESAVTTLQTADTSLDSVETPAPAAPPAS